MIDMTTGRKMLSVRFGRIDPLSIDDYIMAGGYRALSKAMGMARDEIISEIRKSGLRGRGGAAFPTYIKLESLKNADSPKYLVCNGDEGEPGNFKDRYLMEQDPHGYIEGMIISAYAADISKGYIFIRGEYRKSIATAEAALEQARERSLLGRNILNSGFDFDIEVISGAGSYECGEEFALIECMQGGPGHSTNKPPFPTDRGLFGRPTQINNVETFANIPVIIAMGAAEYARIGTETSKGTKLVSLSGNVRRPGLYEVPFGVTLRHIIEELGGGVPEGRSIKMVQLGGSSGPLIPPDMLDLRLDYTEMNKNGLSFGSGAVIVIDDRAHIPDILLQTAEFFLHESCGKCTPCRVGNAQVVKLLSKFVNNTATRRDLELLIELSDTMALTSICGLGQSATTALRSVLRFFPGELKPAVTAERMVV